MKRRSILILAPLFPVCILILALFLPARVSVHAGPGEAAQAELGLGKQAADRGAPPEAQADASGLAAAVAAARVQPAAEAQPAARVQPAVEVQLAAEALPAGKIQAVADAQPARNTLAAEPQSSPAKNETQTTADPQGWGPAAEGIDFQVFRLPDPNNVFVTRMDRSNPNVTIESGIGLGRLAGGKETVSEMARRYDQAINYWGNAWGARNRVVVAVNGYYFDWNTGFPDQGQVHSGWYAKRFDDCETGTGGSGFGWTFDRRAFIGGTISHPDTKQYITFPSGEMLLFTGVNIARGSNDLILYTPQYDTDTNTSSAGVEVLVEMKSPTIISTGGVSGYVRAIYKNQGSTPIPFDHIVLSGAGTTAGSPGARLLNNVAVGAQISISQKIKSYMDGCGSRPSDLDWDGTYASIGGAFLFLKEGEIINYTDEGALARHPRTAVAFNDQYIYFLVVDGRAPGQSIGMTIEELARFARDTLGATWGIAEDGGGSSTMVVNGEVKNNTFCNNVLCAWRQNLPIIVGGNRSSTNAPDAGGGQQIADTAPVPYGDGEDPDLVLSTTLERLVPNGLMMVVVEPASKSGRFTSGEAVQTNQSVELRLGPGTNYPSLASLDQGAKGVVSPHFNGLDGIQAKGGNWWLVDFGGGLAGWVLEAALQKISQ